MSLDIIQQEIYTGSVNIRAHSCDSPLCAPYLATPHFSLHRIGCKNIPSYFAFPIESVRAIYRLRYVASVWTVPQTCLSPRGLTCMWRDVTKRIMTWLMWCILSASVLNLSHSNTDTDCNVCSCRHTCEHPKPSELVNIPISSQLCCVTMETIWKNTVDGRTILRWILKK